MAAGVSSTLPDDWITVDMLAQHAFCARRFHLMYVQGRWEDNVHTVEGRDVHRRVDRIGHLLPEARLGDGTDLSNERKEAGAESNSRGGLPDDDPAPEIGRSVALGSDGLGLMGKLDLVSADPEGGEAIPVETKKGRVPNTPERSHLSERVQLMAQGLLLRDHGYRSGHGYLYFAGSRTRIRVEFSPKLEALTRTLITEARAARAVEVMPPPLEDSPKCWGCSLCGICLPDETNALRTESIGDGHAGPDVRRLYPARDRAMPFYVQEQGARIGKRSERLTVTKQGSDLGSVRLIEVSQVILFGNVQVSSQALHLLMEKAIPVVHFSTGGWFHGMSHGVGVENAYARAAQYAAAADPDGCRRFAMGAVRAKLANQRALLLRNGRGPARDAAVRAIAERIRRRHRDAPADLAAVLGWEGEGASHYFAAFSSMLKTGELPEFGFSSRNRRPPRDPINALLSFAYALLAKECLVALWAEGLDPWWGLFHQPRHGRPALALDLMDPFRPVVADSVVLTAINTGMVGASDFVANANGCALQPAGRKAFLRAWEQRLDSLYTHPAFDYRCSWRTVIRIQARLLGRWLRGDIPDLPWPIVR